MSTDTLASASAVNGLAEAWKRGRSFRIEIMLSAVALAATLALGPALIWAAMLTVSIGLVLAFELVNSSLERLSDHLDPHTSSPAHASKARRFSAT